MNSSIGLFLKLANREKLQVSYDLSYLFEV